MKSSPGSKCRKIFINIAWKIHFDIWWSPLIDFPSNAYPISCYSKLFWWPPHRLSLSFIQTHLSEIHILLSRYYQAEILKLSFPLVRKSRSSAQCVGNGQVFALEKAPSRSGYLCCQLIISTVLRGPPSFLQGHPPPLYPYQITLCKVILAKISQFSCPSPHRQNTLTQQTDCLSAALPEPHTPTATVLSHLLLPLQAWSTPPPPSTTPSSSLTTCPTVDVTFILTGLLSERPREKWKCAPCLIDTTGIPNNSSWRVRTFTWITIVLIFWYWFLHILSAYANNNSFPFVVVRWIGNLSTKEMNVNEWIEREYLKNIIYPHST